MTTAAGTAAGAAGGPAGAVAGAGAAEAWREPAAGERVVNRVPLLELADGTPVALPVVVLRGAADGPTLFVGGGVHGDEVGATAIVQRVIREVDPAQLRGRLVCVPVQNPLAYQVHHRLSLQLVQKSPMDQFPGDPWLDFPGDEHGNGGQVIAHRLFALMREADAVVDIHTPTTGGRYVPFIFAPPARVGAIAERALELARAFRPDFILTASEGVYVGEGRPHVVLAQHGIPAFGFEVGEGGHVDEAGTVRGWEGVRNLMRHLDMLAGEPELEPAPRVITSMTAIRPGLGGLLTPIAPLGADVEEGELIGTVTSLTGEETHELRAPHAGPLMRWTTFAAVGSSERVAQVGIAS